jgi:hypothetical protein
MPGKREERTHLEKREVGLRRVRRRDEIRGGNGGRSKLDCSRTLNSHSTIIKTIHQILNPFFFLAHISISFYNVLG